MALVLRDRVKETTTTTGTGTITLGGAVAGFQSFSVIGNGNTTFYTIEDGTNWEVGIGTYTSSGTTLSRDTVLESSNSGSLVSWGAGTKTVFVTYPAERAIYDGGPLGTPSSGSLISCNNYPATALTGQVPLANGGTAANLSDPNADRILFWDDSAGQVTWLSPGSGIFISGTSLGALNNGTVTSVSGTGTVNGLTLTGTVTSSGSLTLGGTLAISNDNWSGTDLSLANGGTGASLSDPNADRILFWDDSAGAVTWLTVSTGLSLSGTTLTATNTGTVTSVSGTGTVNGLTLSGTVTTSGSLTLGGTLTINNANWSGTDLAIANGGTGASDAATARTNLGLGSLATLSSISNDNWSGTDLSLANGGTGASLSDPNADRILFWDDSAGAVTWLSVGSGLTLSGTELSASGGSGTVTSVDVSGGTTGLTTSGGPITTSGTITLGGTLAVANGGTGATSNTDARTNLGLGTIATQDASSVSISGGTITSTTLDGVTLNNGYTEEVFAVSGTTPALSPTNGSIQTWTLSGNSTPSAGTWAAGQSMTLMIDDGSAFTITWTTLAVTWKSDAGSPPALNTSGFTAIVLWKVGSVIYGARVGDA